MWLVSGPSKGLREYVRPGDGCEKRQGDLTFEHRDERLVWRGEKSGYEAAVFSDIRDREKIGYTDENQKTSLWIKESVLF